MGRFSPFLRRLMNRNTCLLSTVVHNQPIGDTRHGHPGGRCRNGPQRLRLFLISGGRAGSNPRARARTVTKGQKGGKESREIFRGSRGDLANASRRLFLRATRHETVTQGVDDLKGTHGRRASHLGHRSHRLAPKRPPRARGRWAPIELGSTISRADSCVAQRLGHGRCGA